jgi:hypothetical protein
VICLETLNLLDTKNVAGYTYGAGCAERRPTLSYLSRRTLVLGPGITL